MNNGRYANGSARGTHRQIGSLARHQSADFEVRPDAVADRPGRIAAMTFDHALSPAWRARTGAPLAALPRAVCHLDCTSSAI